MKKFFAAALLAGAAVGAFAQAAAPVAPTITWGAYLDTGVAVQTNGDNRAQIGLWGDDAWKNGGRFNLTGKVAAGDYGFNFLLRNQGLLGNASGNIPFYFVSAYTYANFFNKMVYVQAGLVDQRDTRTGGDALASFTKETLGAIVVVRPVDGLSVNVFAAPAAGKVVQKTALTDIAGGKYVNTLSTGANGVGSVVDTITSFGAAYTVPNTVKVMAQGRAMNTVNGYAVTDAYAGLGLLAVPNLTAWLEAGAYGFNDNGNRGVDVITETLAYNFKDAGAPVSVGLNAYQYVYGTDYKTNGTDALNLGLKLTPWVSYAFDNGVVPKLAVTYLSGLEGTIGGYNYGAGAFDSIIGGSYATSAGSANANNYAVLEVKPSVKFVLNPTMSLTFLYSFETSVGADKVYFLSSTSATSLHTFAAATTFSF